MNFEIYKRGQGKWTRIMTFVGGTLIFGVLGEYVWGILNPMEKLSRYVVFGAPVAMLLGGAALMFWIVNRAGAADFMVATEGEMKKVSWSSRKEIIGGTKVVVAATFLLAVLLAAVDLCFAFFFKWVGVLRVE